MEKKPFALEPILGIVRRKIHTLPTVGVVLNVTGMLHLTRQQQLVICVGLFLLLTGWAIKAWKMVNAPVRAAIAADK